MVLDPSHATLQHLLQMFISPRRRNLQQQHQQHQQILESFLTEPEQLEQSRRSDPGILQQARTAAAAIMPGPCLPSSSTPFPKQIHNSPCLDSDTEQIGLGLQLQPIISVASQLDKDVSSAWLSSRRRDMLPSIAQLVTNVPQAQTRQLARNDSWSQEPRVPKQQQKQQQSCKPRESNTVHGTAQRVMTKMQQGPRNVHLQFSQTTAQQQGSLQQCGKGSDGRDFHSLGQGNSLEDGQPYHAATTRHCKTQNDSEDSTAVRGTLKTLNPKPHVMETAVEVNDPKGVLIHLNDGKKLESGSPHLMGNPRDKLADSSTHQWIQHLNQTIAVATNQGIIDHDPGIVPVQLMQALTHQDRQTKRQRLRKVAAVRDGVCNEIKAQGDLSESVITTEVGLLAEVKEFEKDRRKRRRQLSELQNNRMGEAGGGTAASLMGGSSGPAHRNALYQVTQTLCRFWRVGRCSKGQECSFSHDFVPVTKNLVPCK
jgi:hypothetical protein